MSGIRRWLSLSGWGRIMPGIKEAVTRFPLPFVCVIGASVIAMLSLHDIQIVSNNQMARLLYCLSNGAVALTSLKLWLESKHASRAGHMIAAVVVMVVVTWYAWGMFDWEAFSASIYFSSVLILSLLFAPYIKRQSDQPSVWYFNYQSGVAVFFAGIAAIVLGVGVVIILSSLNYLFDIKIPSTIYGDVWILSWGVLFPVYVLGNLSRQFDFEAETCGFPKGIRFIANYILLPLMVVYMAILYAYFVRILVQWELPRGRLTWMIAMFGTLGIITKLLAYPIRNSGTRLLVWFDRYYYLALIVPIILLAIAIGVRIYDYGVTEKRYTIVLMAVWFASVVALSLFGKDRLHIKYVPMILAGLLLAGSLGPWGAVEVSTRSQVSRFENMLSKYQLLQNGQVVKTSSQVPFAARKRLSSITDYLCVNNQRYKRIRPWFKNLLQAAGKKPDAPCSSLGSTGLLKLAGLKYVGEWQVQSQFESFNYYNPVFRTDTDFLDVSGFDYIERGDIYSYPTKKTEQKKFKLRRKNKHKTIVLSGDGRQLRLKTMSGDLLTLDIAKRIKQLRQQHITSITEANSDKLTLNAVSAGGRLRARLVLIEIHGDVPTQGHLRITSVQYLLLVKVNGLGRRS